VIDHDLRAAFTALGDDAAPGVDCPDPARLWDGAHGALDAADRDALLDHVAGCGACIEAWRLARAVAGDDVALPESAAPSRARWWVAGGAAVAAAAALVVWSRAGGDADAPHPPTFRGETSPIASAIGDREVLPRDAFTLRWQPVGPDARYRVIVMTEALDPIHDATVVGAPELTVPAAQLASVAAGATLLWRVEASPPGAAPVRSATFLVRLGP
jgi:hypothetical protein